MCEVKLSEVEFGGAKNDPAHEAKRLTVYEPVLAAHVPASLLDAGEFCAKYQILRNLWHMLQTPKGRLVFLLPRANVGLWEELPPILKCLAPDIRSRILIVAIEEVLDRLQIDARCPSDLRDYAKRLHDKYVILSTMTAGEFGGGPTL